MTTLKICDGCERHVLAPEPRCPFCARPFSFAPAPRRSTRMVMMGLWVMLGASACGTQADPDPAGPAVSTGEVPDTTTTTVASTGVTSMASEGGLTTGTDTAADSSGVDDAMDGGCSFYGGCPDGPALTQECYMTEQDCPEGEKCTPWASTGGTTWTGTHCVPVAPDPAQLDEPCMVEGSVFSGLDDCDVGLLCMGVDPRTNTGTCVASCIGTVQGPGCEQPDLVCFSAGMGSLTICAPPCDPTLQDCVGGEGCFPSELEGFACLPVALPVTAPGGACTAVNECSAGQVCMHPLAFDTCDGEDGCCTEFCSLSNPDADANCAALGFGQQCLPWYRFPPAGLEDVGICAT